MTTAQPLQPTLWRTCRALANRTRLQVFGLLVNQPGASVSAVAECLSLPMPVASQYLRALEARGVLAARRTGRRLTYRPGSLEGAPSVELVAALRRVFQKESAPIETIFMAATAFTHPRRIEIVRALRAGGRTLAELQMATRISARALHRHIKKLEARGFVEYRLGFCIMTPRSDALGRVLARMASE